MVLGYDQDIIRHDDDWENMLCVPNDNLEDLEFFPNFTDDVIRLALLSSDDECFWEDFDTVRSRDEKFAYEQETGLSVFQDEGSRDEIFAYEQETGLSGFQDEESRESCRDIREKSSKKPSVRKPSLSVKRRVCKKPSFRKPCLSVKRRICSHCEAEKTPQWREGPNGPRTLCNACGVRYKSGRLVPEYRPAASPNFDSRKHSNFHKRIVRKGRSCRKEML